MKLKERRELKKQERTKRTEGAQAKQAEVAQQHAERQKLNLCTKAEDYWTTSGDCITRHHRTPRRDLFIPTEDEFAIPLKYIDILRITQTDLSTRAEKRVDDLWTADEGNSKLSNLWAGYARFVVIGPKPKPNHEWVDGIEIRLKAGSRRPGSINQHEWPQLGKKDQDA